MATDICIRRIDDNEIAEALSLVWNVLKNRKRLIIRKKV